MELFPNLMALRVYCVCIYIYSGQQMTCFVQDPGSTNKANY